MAEFFWVMTNVGLAKRAAAEAGGTVIDMRTGQFAVGDGNGAYYEPDPVQTALVNETWRGGLNRVYINGADPTLIVCEALIPISVGGWDIREAGIIDADGDLIAVGKYPLVTKPNPSSGAARAEYVRGGFRISNGGETVLTFDDSLVMATQEELDNHAALTAPHQATSLATANRLMLRDGNGRAQVSPPAAAADIAIRETVDEHAALTSPHNATSAATADRLILRDGAGRAKIAAPVDNNDIANKGYVTYANLPDKPNILSIVYPVGSYYINHDDNRNPNTILGFGTWTAVLGQFLLGVSGTYPAGTQGGEASHVLTAAEMPAHTHPMTGDTFGSQTINGTQMKVAQLNGSGQGDEVSVATLTAGGGLAHNNMPPYETAFIWRRTA